MRRFVLIFMTGLLYSCSSFLCGQAINSDGQFLHLQLLRPHAFEKEGDVNADKLELQKDAVVQIFKEEPDFWVFENPCLESVEQSFIRELNFRLNCSWSEFFPILPNWKLLWWGKRGASPTFHAGLPVLSRSPWRMAGFLAIFKNEVYGLLTAQNATYELLREERTSNGSPEPLVWRSVSLDKSVHSFSCINWVTVSSNEIDWGW